MDFPTHIRRVQARLDDVLAAYRARAWGEVWRLFQALTNDVEAAKSAAFTEEKGR